MKKLMKVEGMHCGGCSGRLKRILEALPGVTEAGADAFELGIPFSDPSADGPVICLSSKRALANGSDTQKCLQVVQQYRAKHPDMPISLMIYINLAYAPGLDHFFAVEDRPRCEERKRHL